MSVDKTTLMAIRKKGNRPGNVVKGRKTSHGNASRYIGIAVGSSRLIGVIHLGLHPSGADGIDSYAASSPFGRKCARKTNQAMLRSVVS